MFTVRADYSESFEIKANLEDVRDFFADIENFIELMPSIESTKANDLGVMNWKIRADVPLVGSFVEKFQVEEIENNDELVEWGQIKGEKYNLIRYSAEFMPKSEDSTLVNFSQIIELRRKSASELHFLAGFAGEKVISQEMSRQIGEMLKNFIATAKTRLES